MQDNEVEGNITGVVMRCPDVGWLLNVTMRCLDEG
jgi:hypothetical protein